MPTCSVLYSGHPAGCGARCGAVRWSHCWLCARVLLRCGPCLLSRVTLLARKGVQLCNQMMISVPLQNLEYPLPIPCPDPALSIKIV